MMKEFTIYPLLGLKTNVIESSPEMFKMVADGVAYTHGCEGTQGFSPTRERGVLTKTYGTDLWGTGTFTGLSRIRGLFELDDGIYKDHLVWGGGKVFVVNNTLGGDDITPSGVTFASDYDDLVCAIRVGSYVVFTDAGSHVPYKWKHGDTACTELIDASGAGTYTDYKFKYLLYFQNRIGGLYTDETNGDISIRWTDIMPDLSGDVEFPLGNQLFIPNSDPIIGVSQIGLDRAYIHCRKSLHQMIYYQDYVTPFRLSTLNTRLAGQHHSIVNTENANYFYVKEQGFVRFDGTNISVISDDINDFLNEEITPASSNRLVGTYLPYENLIVWNMLYDQISYLPARIVIYDIKTGQWEYEGYFGFGTYFVDTWEISEGLTWTEMVTAIGYAIWDYTLLRDWDYYINERSRLMFGSNSIYVRTGDALYGASTLSSYRYEPIMDFGNPWRRDLLKEIWFSITYSGNWSVTVYHRSGDTVGEVKAATWVSLGTVSCNSVDNPVLYVNQNNRFHQIRYQNTSDDQRVQIEKITFKYEPGKEY